MSTEAQKRAVKKAQEKTDAIMLRPTKENGARIRSAAAFCGKSVSSFIFDIVFPVIEQIENENKL